MSSAPLKRHFLQVRMINLWECRRKWLKKASAHAGHLSSMPFNYHSHIYRRNSHILHQRCPARNTSERFLSRLFSVCLQCVMNCTHKTWREKIHCRLFLRSSELWEEAHGHGSLIPSEWLHTTVQMVGARKAEVVSHRPSVSGKRAIAWVKPDNQRLF